MLLAHVWSSAFHLVLCVQINNSVCQAISSEVLKVAFQVLYALFSKMAERGTDVIITHLSFLYRCQAQHSAQLLEREVGFCGHNTLSTAVVNMCRKETHLLTFSSSSLGMTLLRSNSVHRLTAVQI